MDYLLERLKEPSTWRGLVVLLGVFGAKISPELNDAFINNGLLVAAIVGVFTRG